MGNDQVTLATGLVTVGPKSHFDFFGAGGSQFAATYGMGSYGIDPNGIGDKA